VSLAEGDFSGCDLDSAIDLNGIEIDDLTVERESQLDGEFALTRSGGPHDGWDQLRCVRSAGHRTMLATTE